jgi:hypothetical protein
MLEEVVADASIAVDAEADAEDQADFRRFLDGTSPAELIRNLGRARQDASLEPEAEAEAEGQAPEDGEPGPDPGESPAPPDAGP